MTTFPWQKAAWQQLHTLRSALPHAIIFHGPRGIGKTHLAERWAHALLCEAAPPDDAGEACGVCLSCRWLSQGTHPDYRYVGLEEKSSENKEQETTETKPLSKEIKIDQVRALGDFMNISTHRHGLRVVVLSPAEALNTMAANALLKTLEEPPPQTLFLLVTHQLHQLLPTVVSRCRKFALSPPPRHQALDWLATQQVTDATRWLAASGGAPMQALAAFQQREDDRERWDRFFDFLSHPSTSGALSCAEQLQKTPLIDTLLSIQRWLFDLLLTKLMKGIPVEHTQNVHYYPQHTNTLAALAARTDKMALLAAQKSACYRRAYVEHPLSARLFLEALLLDYVGLFERSP